MNIMIGNEKGKGNIRQPGIPHSILYVGFRFSSSNSTHAFSNELLLKVFTTMSRVFPKHQVYLLGNSYFVFTIIS